MHDPEKRKTYDHFGKQVAGTGRDRSVIRSIVGMSKSLL